MASQSSELEKQLRFSKFDYKQGLSNNTVYSIVQDENNMLWLATSDGLNRFDGYNFKIYHQERNKPNSLLSDVVRFLYIDIEKQLWIGSRDGLSHYNKEKDNFDNYLFPVSNGTIFQINAISDFDENNLLLGTDNGLTLFNKEGKTFEKFQSPENAQTHIQSLYKQDDNIFIGTNSGLYIYQISGRYLSLANEIFNNSRIQAILPKSATEIWIGTEGDGLYLFNTQLKTYSNYKHSISSSGSISSNYVRSLAYDENGNLWIGTFQGLSILLADENRFLNHSHNPMDNNSISQNSIRAIFKDNQGGMWLGTYYGGLNYFHTLKNQFGYIRQIPYTQSLNDRIVSAMLEGDDGKILIGTNDKGINLYDPATGNFRYFTRENKSIVSNNIKVFLKSKKNNNVYIGSHGGGLLLLDINNGKSTPVPVPYENVYALTYDNQNNIWIGTLNGLFRYNESSKELFQINTSELSSEQTLFLKLDSKNRLWIGGERSLGVYDLNINKLKNYKPDDYNGTISNGAINCIIEDSKNNIWFGTRGGFCKYEENDNFKSYSSSEGLSNNSVYGIIEDKAGRLWLSTNNGLDCFDPETETFRNYSDYDGLPFDQFNNYSFLKSRTGLFYFGGIDGLVTFYPELLKDNPFTEKPRITKIQISNKEILPGDESGVLTENILNTKIIKLNSKQSNIAIEFVVPNFLSGMHNFFAYKLIGFDDDWNYTSDKRFVNYSNLPPGKYTFAVKAANSDGKWDESITELKIIVRPPWWKTWWAMLLFGLIIITAILLTNRFYLQRKKMQSDLDLERCEKERIEKLNQMKLRFFINISHEFKTPLTLILSPIQEMLEKTTDKWELSQLNVIQKNANKLLYLINQLMDYRRAELGVFEMNLNYVYPKKQILEIFSLFEKLAKQKNINYNIIDRTNSKKFVVDLKYLELILTNLLSNSFKFTPENGSITVTMDEDIHHFILEVEDNGSGIPEDKLGLIFDRFYQVEHDVAGTGIGLSLIKRLVDLHHGEIKVKSVLGRGSTFTIYFPQDDSYYNFDEIEKKSINQESQKLQPEFLTEEFEPEILSKNDVDEDNKDTTIMVVEDNEDVLNYLDERLSKRHRIVRAINGVDALEKLKNNEVELIITDVMMPEMDGVKFCKAIKQNIRTSHIPVIMLSAKSNIEDQLAGLQVGADDYVAKPFTFSVLNMKVQNMLRSRRMMREHYTSSLEVEPEKIAFNEMDKQIMQKAKEIVMKNLDNPDFSADIFSSDMNMSRSNLHLKLKAITGESTIDFIRKIRFGEAIKLLLDGRYNVAEVSTMVGFNTPSYFATSFKKYFGMLPTEYVKKSRG